MEKLCSVAILDAGAQYGKVDSFSQSLFHIDIFSWIEIHANLISVSCTQVIDRRIRELNVLSELLPLDTEASKLRDYKAIIISGGPNSVYDDNAPQYDAEIFKLGIPILGSYFITYVFHFRVIL